MLKRGFLKGSVIDSGGVGMTSGGQEVLYAEVTLSWNLGDQEEHTQEGLR